MDDGPAGCVAPIQLMLQDTAGLLTINGFALPAKLAEKRKLIEEFAHNDVKKVSKYTYTSLHTQVLQSFNFSSHCVSSYLCLSAML